MIVYVMLYSLLVDDSHCRREQRCNSTSDMRPGDIFHPNFQHGLPTYIDVTVRNSLQPAYLVRAASHAGAAAEAGEMENATIDINLTASKSGGNNSNAMGSTTNDPASRGKEGDPTSNCAAIRIKVKHVHD